MPTRLSKSKYLSGLQCPKLLWTYFNKPDLIPPPGPGQQHIFDTGHAIGDLAKELYPGGIEIPMNFADPAVTVSETLALLERQPADCVPIFEASFLVDGRYCRVDVLVPEAATDDPKSTHWSIVEVKSSTRVREVNLHDVAFQADTLTRAGLTLHRCYVMHVNTGYVRADKFDVSSFFHLEDVTARAEKLEHYVHRSSEKMLNIIEGSNPDTPLGKRCNTPYACPLKAQCWSVLPPNNVTELYYSGVKAFDMLDEGLFDITAVPDSRLGHQQRIQKRTVITGEPQVDRDHLKPWLDELQYPLYFLDFETMNPALPPFQGIRPYQRLPFQFSIHIQETPGAKPRHVDFIASTAGDPRPGLVRELHAIGAEGTILAWSMGFEKGVLNDLAEVFPAEAEWLASLNDRIVDLMVPFRSFWYHDPGQHGSCSLKAVLPALTEMDYEELAIADGNHAARAYAAAMYGDAKPEEQEDILGQLLEYCRLDTLAMVEILNVLYSATKTAEGHHAD